jgi:hypothetical protein
MSEPTPPTKIDAVVVDVQIPFFSLVVLLVKVTLAAIPAAIVVAIVTVFVATLVGGYASILSR